MCTVNGYIPLMVHAHAAIKTCTNSALTYNIGCGHHVLMQACMLFACALVCFDSYSTQTSWCCADNMCLQRCVNRVSVDVCAHTIHQSTRSVSVLISLQ